MHSKDNIFKKDKFKKNQQNQCRVIIEKCGENKLHLTTKTFDIGIKECYLFQNFQRDLMRKGQLN